MKRILPVLLYLAGFSLVSACSDNGSLGGEIPPPEVRRIAFTFDDAPRPGARQFSGPERTERLIRELSKGGVAEATFFVTTRHIGPDNHGMERLNAYIRAGHRLANHSHNHTWLRETPAVEYIADIDKASGILQRFDAVDPWFRFPYLDEGQTAAQRDAIRAALKDRKLTNGYVTVDTYDWYMGTLFQKALDEGRAVDFDKLRDVYVETLVAGAEFYDALARKVLRRSPAHVMLLHENDLAALFIADLAEGLRAKGWTIISTRQAYQDPIASVEPDTLFLGQGRISAIAHERGVRAKDLISKMEDEAYLKALFEKEGVFGPAPKTQ